MLLSIIAALDEDGAIGRAAGGLPWHIPEETAHFRAYCAGKWLLAGRRTFEEMKGWFQPGQRVLVLTQGSAGVPGPGRAVRTIPEAMALAEKAGAGELVALGGAQVFALALPFASRLVLSRLHHRSGGDVFFPRVEWGRWRPAASESREDAATGIRFVIERYERLHEDEKNGN